MVTINNFEILNDGSLAISVETVRGNLIESILLWSMYDFRDYSLSVDVSDRIVGINNIEVIIIPKEEVPIDISKELIFMEVRDNTNADCGDALGVTYDLNHFRRCLLDYLFREYNVNDLSNCNDEGGSTGMTVMIDLLITTVESSLELGHYGQAIEIIEKLRVLCKGFNCGCSGSSGNSSPCSKFKQF